MEHLLIQSFVISTLRGFKNCSRNRGDALSPNRLANQNTPASGPSDFKMPSFADSTFASKPARGDGNSAIRLQRVRA